jgi:hypothetical protein
MGVLNNPEPSSAPPDIRSEIKEREENKAQEERRKRFEDGRIKLSPESMPEIEYQRAYLGGISFVNRGVMEAAEEYFKCLYCPSCVTTGPHGRVTASKMLVTKEEDPLRNFPFLAHLHCHHCGFEEFIPFKQSRFYGEDLSNHQADAALYGSQVVLSDQMGLHSHSRGLTATEINMRQRDYELRKQQMAAKQSAQLSAQINSAMLGITPGVAAAPDPEGSVGKMLREAAAKLGIK